MASFVYTVWSITNVASMHCSVRPEISPCTCEPIFASNYVELSCEKVDSFHQIVNALSNKFTPNVSISLLVSHSQLDDLEMRSFNEMNLNMKKLRLISDNLKSVPELPFRGLSNVEFLSLAENDLEEIPKHVLNHLPKISTLDLGKGRIRSVNHDDFKGIPKTRYLILVSNNITRIDKGSFPPGVLSLHLGRNQISTLNGTLRELYDLQSLFINMNNLTTLENELPPSQHLKFILGQNNDLTSLPQSFKDMPKLESLFFQNNKLKSFDGVFKNSKNIMWLIAYNNEIEYLSDDEFLEASVMEELDLSNNHLKSLNYSLLPLKKLKSANFSFNQMEEFSINEIRGLLSLRSLDISNNLIKKLTGRKENLIESNSFLVDLKLHHNLLKSLDGALMGLNKLRILSLTHNQIERILPDDFIGLESLEILDLSHNQLLTLEETSTTYLPSLKILKVAYNNLTSLDKDFHGLPVLCQANFTHNQISSISVDLVSKTRCSNHGVSGKLEVWLDDNPIMCDPMVAALCPIMESQEARIRGHSHCMDSNQEICSDRPIILQAPLTLIPEILQTKLPTTIGQPSLVQVIVPGPLISSKSIIKSDYLHSSSSATLKSKITTTTTTTILPPSDEIDDQLDLITTMKPLYNSSELNITYPIISTMTTMPTTTTTTTPTTTTPTTITTEKPIVISSSTSKPLIIDEHTDKDDYVIIDLVENLNENLNENPLHDIIKEELLNTSSEGADDNSVHEKFSPFIVKQPENPQLILTPEEPPETS